MKNTSNEGHIRFVIVGNEDKYIGICREFGFVEEGKTHKEVQDKLINSSVLLLETVAENPHLAPSLNTSPPFKYLLVYYFVVFSSTLAKLRYNFVSFMDINRGNLVHA